MDAPPTIEAPREPPEKSPAEIARKTFARSEEIIFKHGQFIMLDSRRRQLINSVLNRADHYRIDLKIPELQVDWEGTPRHDLYGTNPSRFYPVYQSIEFRNITVTEDGKENTGKVTLKFDKETGEAVFSQEGFDQLDQEPILQALDQQIQAVDQHFRDKDRTAQLGRALKAVKAAIKLPTK